MFLADFTEERISVYRNTEEPELQPKHERRGNCWDNAVAESFFSSLKKALIYQQKFESKEAARIAIFEYIEIFYNRIRLQHSNIVHWTNLRKSKKWWHSTSKMLTYA
ncbi:MAG: hypothetical protein EKK48_10610 [Candidatus Melainabacteria bacterium]|nr:MAG: hypothetical protein EKK48_10610 [Candidatus Melainabacteria bacterium]